MKISEMNQQELEYFAYLCSKFEIQTSSTEGLREVITNLRKTYETQEKEIKDQIVENKKLLSEYEKMIGNLEKGGLKG